MPGKQCDKYQPVLPCPGSGHAQEVVVVEHNALPWPYSICRDGIPRIKCRRRLLRVSGDSSSFRLGPFDVRLRLRVTNRALEQKA